VEPLVDEVAREPLGEVEVGEDLENDSIDMAHAGGTGGGGAHGGAIKWESNKSFSFQVFRREGDQRL
jgi:hypothetical protein